MKVYNISWVKSCLYQLKLNNMCGFPLKWSTKSLKPVITLNI